MMNDMEMDYAGQIVEWAMTRYKGIEDVTHEQMVNEFWSPLLPREDYSLQSEGDSEPMDDLTFFEKNQPFC